MTDIATTDQAPAPSGPRARIEQFIEALKKRQDQLSTLLSDTGVSPERFLEVARRAFSMNPDLLTCDAGSLMKAFINAATDGLLPDGKKGAIVVYKRRDGSKEANWQPMVAGLLYLAHASGLYLSIEARIVYEGDFFDYDLGDNPFIHHKPKARPVGFKPAITNAYAVAKTTNGGVYREVFEADDIAKVKAMSRALNGPWKDHEGEMIRKGPLRRLWKFLPKNKAMERIAESDDVGYDLDLTATEVSKPRRLQTGFSPKAITQDVTPTVDIPIDREMEPEVVEAHEEHPSADARMDPGPGASEGEDVPSNTAPPPQIALPPDYDIGAWAKLTADALGKFEAVGEYDGWRNDPETTARLDRLKAVKPMDYDTLVSAAKARRLKLSRAT